MTLANFFERYTSLIWNLYILAAWLSVMIVDGPRMFNILLVAVAGGGVLWELWKILRPRKGATKPYGKEYRVPVAMRIMGGVLRPALYPPGVGRPEEPSEPEIAFGCCTHAYHGRRFSLFHNEGKANAIEPLSRWSLTMISKLTSS